MVTNIRKHFYWPSLTTDVVAHCKSCKVCQNSIDLVGPFPKARGGFQYLLTYIDIATRWPEAISLRTTTTKVIVAHLKSIFCRNGFLSTLVGMNLHIGGSCDDFTCQRTMKPRIHTRTATINIVAATADCLLPQEGAAERQMEPSRQFNITHELQRGVCASLWSIVSLCVYIPCAQASHLGGSDRPGGELVNVKWGEDST